MPNGRDYSKRHMMGSKIAEARSNYVPSPPKPQAPTTQAAVGMGADPMATTDWAAASKQSNATAQSHYKEKYGAAPK